MDVAREIRERVSIMEVLSYYNLRPDRRGFLCCPFHSGDHTASLKVYPEQNSWYCYGCQKSGSVIDFVMEFERMDLRQAIIHLDRQFDLRLIADKMDERQRREAQKLAVRREKVKEETMFRELQRKQYLMDLLEYRRELHWETILLSVNAYDHEAAQKKALLMAEIEQLDYEIEEVSKQHD